ncbi:MAG: peptidoglycan DD-metalloendopeptidase family protein [Myxococcota bacterium]
MKFFLFVATLVQCLAFSDMAHAFQRTYSVAIRDTTFWRRSLTVNPLNLNTFSTVQTAGNGNLILLDLNGGALEHGDLVTFYAAIGTTADQGRFLTTNHIHQGPASAESVYDYSNSIWLLERTAGPGTVRRGDRVRFVSFSEMRDASVAFSSYTNRFSLVNSTTATASVMVHEEARGALQAGFSRDWFLDDFDSSVDPGPTVRLSAPYYLTRWIEAGNRVDVDWKRGVIKGSAGPAMDNHNAIDFGSGRPGFRMMELGGIELLAAAGGVVVELVDGNEDRCHGSAGPSVCPGGGNASNILSIKHSDGTVSRYVHNMKNSPVVKLNEEVKCGQPLARIGSAGPSSAPHVHFELRRPVDPRFWSMPQSIPLDTWEFERQTYIVDPFTHRLWWGTHPESGDLTREVPNLVCVPEDRAFMAQLAENDEVVLMSRLTKGYEFDPCVTDNDCGSETFCGKDLTGGPACRLKRPLGSTCSRDEHCTVGLACSNGRCSTWPCTNQCPEVRGCYMQNGSCVRPVHSAIVTPVTCGSTTNCPSSQGCFVAPFGYGCIRVEVSTRVSTESCAMECLP